MTRHPAVAGRFYPGSEQALARQISGFMTPGKQADRQAIAAVAPHAGYVYSGELAAQTLCATIIPEQVVILGVNHHGRGAAVALSAMDWEIPGATIPHATELSDSLQRHCPDITIDEQAHRFEHSLEVQVPLLRALQPRLRIAPVAFSHLSFGDCVRLAEDIAEAVKQCKQSTLLVASSDMSHYESRAQGSKKDKKALAHVLALDGEGLYNTVHGEQISMCGVIPVTITILAARHLGATRAELIGYTDSGAVSGDTDQVVGYAGVVIE
jgi:AmmeMemoRadiSam system protein B